MSVKMQFSYKPKARTHTHTYDSWNIHTVDEDSNRRPQVASHNNNSSLLSNENHVCPMYVLENETSLFAVIVTFDHFFGIK